MSLAYLDLGAVAASKENHWDMYQQAVAYQMLHASELFLKFAILSKTQEGSIKEHSISRLLSKYDELYPEKTFSLKLPFDFRENTGKSEEERALIQSHIERFNPRFLDQHLRYPSNHNTGGYSFHFDVSYFEAIKAKFEEIGGKILATC
jgi:HEPN domain-containing protein